MKKRKPPKLVVDNELPDDDEDGWKVICEQVADFHRLASSSSLSSGVA
jgi:hypothetical protein